MSNIVASNSFEAALIQGDLSKLSPEQRLNYYKSVCESVGLNPLTKPFDYIQLNGKLTLYAKRDATDQLRKIHKVSLIIVSRELVGDIYVVTARAKDADGREDESTGAVNTKGLFGEALANVYMKAETKSKRRVTLSICGLGMLDETEVESIPNAKVFRETPPPQIQQKPKPIVNHADAVVAKHNAETKKQPQHLDEIPFPSPEDEPPQEIEEAPPVDIMSTKDNLSPQDKINAKFITIPQTKRLWVISKEAGYTYDHMKEIVTKGLNAQSTTEIPWQKYNQLIECIEMRMTVDQIIKTLKGDK